MAYALSMNPYSAPDETIEFREDQKLSNGEYWLFWLAFGFILVLFAIRLIGSAIYHGPVSSECLASVTLVAGVGCLNQALETSKKTMRT